MVRPGAITGSNSSAVNPSGAPIEVSAWAWPNPFVAVALVLVFMLSTLFFIVFSFLTSTGLPWMRDRQRKTAMREKYFCDFF
jgi:hypothetical protein